MCWVMSIQTSGIHHERQGLEHVHSFKNATVRWLNIVVAEVKIVFCLLRPSMCENHTLANTKSNHQ